MKMCIRLLLCSAVCFLCARSFAQESAPAPAARELKQPELLPIAFIKLQPPKEFISELIASSRALGFESEAAFLPLLVGGTLGDPELKSFAPDADISIVFLNAVDRPQPYVFLTKLIPDAPVRAKFEEMGLKVGKLGDWTVLARNGEFIRRLEGSKSLMSIALKKRAADIEIGLWTDRLADQIDANKNLFIETLAANSEDFAVADTKASISGLLDVMNGELRSMEYFMVGLNLSEEKIASQLQLKGKADTALAAYLSAPVGGAVKGSEYIPKKGVLYLLSKMNPAASETYFDYLLKKTVASTSGKIAAFFTEFHKLNGQVWKLYDGDSALALNIDGEKPVIIQAMGSSHSPAEIAKLSQSILENFMNDIQAILPEDAKGSVRISIEAKEDAYKVGNISVMEMITKTTVDQSKARVEAIEKMLEEARVSGNKDMEAEALRMKKDVEAQWPIEEVTTESTYVAGFNGVLYSATNRSDLTLTLKAAEAGKPLPNNLSALALPEGCVALINYDMAFFSELMAMQMEKEDPLQANAFKNRLASVTLEPITVSVFQGDSKLSVVSEVPLRSVGELIKAAKGSPSDTTTDSQQ